MAYLTGIYYLDRMKTKTPDWKIWAIVILFFAFLGGLFYVMRYAKWLPLVIFIIIPLVSYCLYKDKISFVKYEATPEIILMLNFIWIVAMIYTAAKFHLVHNYLSEFIVDGRYEFRMVTMEADDSPATWEERKKLYIPNTVKGQRIMDFLELFIGFLMIGSFILICKYYGGAKIKLGRKD